MSMVCAMVQRSSVRPSICPIGRQRQRLPAGLLLSAMRAGDIDRQLRARCGRRAAGAGAQQQMRLASLTLRAKRQGSTWTRFTKIGSN